MITGELKSKIDRIWDTMWSGGISNPLSVIEQLTYLLFIKRLDELETLKENKAARTGKPALDPIFKKGQDALRWSRFKQTAPEQMLETVRDKVFPFIKSLGTNGHDDRRGLSPFPVPGRERGLTPSPSQRLATAGSTPPRSARFAPSWKGTLRTARPAEAMNAVFAGTFCLIEFSFAILARPLSQ